MNLFRNARECSRNPAISIQTVNAGTPRHIRKTTLYIRRASSDDERIALAASR